MKHVNSQESWPPPFPGVSRPCFQVHALASQLWICQFPSQPHIRKLRERSKNQPVTFTFFIVVIFFSTLWPWVGTAGANWASRSALNQTCSICTMKKNVPVEENWKQLKKQAKTSQLGCTVWARGGKCCWRTAEGASVDQDTCFSVSDTLTGRVGGQFLPCD